MSKSAECVKVILRCRPMNKKEESDRRQRIVDMDTKNGVVRVRNPKSGEHPQEFTFDAVFDWNCVQPDVYDITARPIVESVLDGFNGTVFAYGQTGTGKTWTMEGSRDNQELKGVIPRTFDHIFESIGSISDKNFLVRASYLELYNEDIRDLLKKDHANKLELKETPDSGVYVKDLSSYVVKSAQEIQQVFTAGNQNRTVGATLMNADSSRSHSIFTIVIEQSGMGGQDGLAMGKLNLVDLAGSERQSKTGATGDRLKEATKINLSLSALGNVIKALVASKKGHVPYRDSKLTRLLQDSLGGNAKTVMVANLGPADYNYDETVNTLRYANRAKSIKNKPKINEDPKDAMLREFQDEISKLRAQIAAGEPGGGTEVRIIEEKGDRMDEAELEAEKEKIRKEIEGDLQKSDEEKAALLRQHEAAMREKEQALAEQQALENKLKMLEGKMVVGGENLLDRVAKEEAQQKRLNMRLEEQRRTEGMMQKRMEEQQELNLEKEAHYGSLQEEVADLDRKLGDGLKRYKEQQRENQDARAEFEREKEELRENIKDLSYKFKFQQLVLAHYIPEEVLHKIESTAEYDGVREEWLVIRLNYAGNVLRARYPERYASTKEGAAAMELEQQQERQHAMAMMHSQRAMHGGGFGGMGDEYHMQQMQMAAAQQMQQESEDKYLSYAEMEYQDEEQRSPPGGASASKTLAGNSRARATKAKLKAAVAASALLHDTQEKDKEGKVKDKERERRRRKKREQREREREETAAVSGAGGGGGEGGALERPARAKRPGTASRRRGDKELRRSKEKQVAQAAAPAAEELYPESRGTVNDGMRYA